MNTHNTESWAAIDAEGNEVKVGQEIVSFRGETFTFKAISRAPGVGSSGKILVSSVTGTTHEFYPRVFDMTLGYKPALGRKR